MYLGLVDDQADYSSRTQSRSINAQSLSQQSTRLRNTTSTTTTTTNQHRVNGVSAERILIGYATINAFLSAFIDHALRDVDFVVKRKLMLEKLLGYSPRVGKDGVFYTGTEKNVQRKKFLRVKIIIRIIIIIKLFL